MNNEYVREVITENTGGGCMVDYIKLKNGRVIGISDECVVLYESEEAAQDGIHHDNDVIYFEEDYR
jgi:hypothetical protein